MVADMDIAQMDKNTTTKPKPKQITYDGFNIKN